MGGSASFILKLVASGRLGVLPHPTTTSRPALPAETPTDPAQAVADWSRDCLIVPPGHPKAGEPMELPDYGVAFLRDVFTHSETCLLCRW